MMETNFDDLLQKAEQLQAEIDLPFPRIERNIKQLYEVGHNLWTRTGYHSSRDTNEVRASVLLGLKGYDLQKVNQRLENLNSELSNVESAKVSDIHGFLRNERENTVLTAIEEVKNRTFELMDNKCWAKISKDWESQKVAILGALVGEEKEGSTSMTPGLSLEAVTPRLRIRDDAISPTPKDSANDYTSILKLMKWNRSSQDSSIPPPDRFITSLSNILRENKDYDLVLGYKINDGNRIPGLIDQYHDDPKTIITQIAMDCEGSGLIEEAISLYDLASEDNKTVELLIKHLNPLISAKKVPGSKKQRLEAVALKLAERYHLYGHNANKELVSIFHLILDLITFFHYYHTGKYEDAMETIEKLNLIPLKMELIDTKANEFGSYAEEIRRNIPEVLVAVMSVLHAQYKKLKSLTPQASNKFGIIGNTTEKEAILQSLKEKARLLITYAGMIPYRMPGDINARLVQLEVMMS
ncbi:nuclear pore complex protein Nup93-like [Brevipalpus obovatus]|uniref:nuclear pore complex protein Nup93-like n=1 Tax=Brevipalpus obovatus TaxID=246614 RepID=UPI003D9ED30F